MNRLLNAETLWAAIGIASCIVVAFVVGCCAVALSSIKSRGGRSWYVEFLLATGSILLLQAPVFLLALVAWLFSGPRPAAVGGTAAAWALDLAATMGLEVMVFRGQGFLFPIVYIFSLPGALLGALAIILWLGATQQGIAPFDTFAISAAAVLASAVISHAAFSYYMLRKREPVLVPPRNNSSSSDMRHSQK